MFYHHVCCLRSSCIQYGDTPLHTAARYGHAGVTQILISAKCGVNETNKVSDIVNDPFLQNLCAVKFTALCHVLCAQQTLVRSV